MAYRFDTQTFNPNQLRPPWTNADGSTVFDAYLAAERVLTYTRPDGTQRREFRPAEENKKARGLFGLIPSTDEHPPGLLCNLKDNDQYKKGITLPDPQFIEKGGYIRNAIAVLDSRLAEEVKSGEKNQLSTGYKCDTEEIPGIWIDAYGVMGMPGASYPYDAIQRNIIPDHQAFTRKGRAGTDIAAFVGRLDSAADQDVAWAECPTCPPIHQEHSNRTDSECGCKEQPMAEQFVTGAAPLERADGGKKKGMMITLDTGDGNSRIYEIDESDREAVMDMMSNYKERTDSLEADLEAALDLIEELQARLDSEPDDNDDGEFEVPEGYVLVDEDWATPLLEMQENIDSAGSDMHIVDCWAHNESEYFDLQEKYDSLVDERVDSVFDEDDVNKKIAEIMQSRVDSYNYHKPLLGNTMFDVMTEAEEWATKALEANGVKLDSDDDPKTAVKLLLARADSFGGQNNEEEADPIAAVRRQLTEVLSPYSDDRSDSVPVDPLAARNHAWNQRLNDWKD